MSRFGDGVGSNRNPSRPKPADVVDAALCALSLLVVLKRGEVEGFGVSSLQQSRSAGLFRENMGDSAHCHSARIQV